MTKVAAIIAAGGRGIRMGAARPKQHLTLGGMTILQRSVAAFDGSERIDEIVVVLPDLSADLSPVSAPRGTPLRTVVGGARRQDSVARGFDAVSPDVPLVVIHDAALRFDFRDEPVDQIDISYAFEREIGKANWRQPQQQM